MELTYKDLESFSDFVTYKSHNEVLTDHAYPEVTIIKPPTISILNKLLLTKI